VTWCALDDAGWRLRATLPSGVTEWIPPPRSATDAQGTHRDHYESLADVGEMALWLAIRWVRAHPRPRSIAALAGWDVVPVSDPRLTDLRAAYVAALWWSRAMTAFFNGVHTDDVERAETARAQALAAYQGAWHQLRREAVVAWQRRRDAEKRARGD
jgi:hypothetical protein